MKRLAVCIGLFASVSLLSMKAEIKPRKEGKVLLVEFYYPKDSNADIFEDNGLSLDYIETDLKEAFATADKQKCNALIFYDKQGEMFKILKGKGWVKNTETNLALFRKYIDELCYTKHIEGEIIGKKTIKTGVAKYRQDTYLNGKLHDTYESDWSQGWFAPSTSTYKIGGDTYVTETYYQPPQTKEIYERAPGTDIIIEGTKVFVEKVYRL